MQRFPVPNYHIAKADKYGSQPERRWAYDKLVVVVIALNRKQSTEDRLLGMLNTLLSPDKPYEQKIAELEKKYQMHLRSDEQEEVRTMCNFSEYVEEIGIEKGIQRGVQQTIGALISVCRDLGLSQADTMSRIQNGLALPEETAQEYMEQYWQSGVR